MGTFHVRSDCLMFSHNTPFQSPISTCIYVFLIGLLLLYNEQVSIYVKGRKLMHIVERVTPQKCFVGTDILKLVFWQKLLFPCSWFFWSQVLIAEFKPLTFQMYLSVFHWWWAKVRLEMWIFTLWSSCNKI